METNKTEEETRPAEEEKEHETQVEVEPKEKEDEVKNEKEDEVKKEKEDEVKNEKEDEVQKSAEEGATKNNVVSENNPVVDETACSIEDLISFADNAILESDSLRNKYIIIFCTLSS